MIRFLTVTLVWIIFAVGLQSRARADHMELGPQDKLVLGWLEKIVLKPGDIVLRAKLDTGANTASIDAENIIFFEKDDQPWVRFAFLRNKRNDKPKKLVEFERPLVRTEQIKEHFGESQQRPVVTLQFCLHGTLFETEFNLVDRTNFKYPVLLGRRFLQKIALVDPESTQLINTIQRDCNPPEMDVEVKDVEAKDEYLDTSQNPQSSSEADRSDAWEAGTSSDQDPGPLPAQPIAQSPDAGPEEIGNDAAGNLARNPQDETNRPDAAQGDKLPKLHVSLQDREQ